MITITIAVFPLGALYLRDVIASAYLCFLVTGFLVLFHLQMKLKLL